MKVTQPKSPLSFGGISDIKWGNQHISQRFVLARKKLPGREEDSSSRHCDRDKSEKVVSAEKIEIDEGTMKLVSTANNPNKS